MKVEKIKKMKKNGEIGEFSAFQQSLNINEMPCSLFSPNGIFNIKKFSDKCISSILATVEAKESFSKQSL